MDPILVERFRTADLDPSTGEGDDGSIRPLEVEAALYLDAVETFRAEDCEPTWKLERVAS